LTHKRSIYQFVENGKHWAYDVGKLFGNADYLMLQNLDYTSEALVKETNDWGKWITKDLNLTGFRLDAVQHFSYHFADKWCKDLQKSAGKNMFFVGEFWNGDVKVLTKWLNNMSPFFRLFDVPLMYNLARVSSFESPDLREVFKNTLVSARPSNAVVSNSSDMVKQD
jgi:alpha-amylase